MHRLTALLRNALRLIGFAKGFRGRLIADRETKQLPQRRLAAPRNQNRSRLGRGDFEAEPFGGASVVKKIGSYRRISSSTRPSAFGTVRSSRRAMVGATSRLRMRPGEVPGLMPAPLAMK